jgi:hypothetical protein
MNFIRPRFAALKLSTRLFVICAAFGLVASVLGTTAYVQSRGKAAAQEPSPAGRIEKLNVRAPERKEETAEAQAAPADEILPSVASNYSDFTATNGSLTDMSAGTTQLLGANIDDTASTLTNIGFDFYFQGARFTQFSVNENGVLRLGAGAQAGSPYKPLAQAGIPLLTAYGADQRTHAGDGKVHFKVNGSAPNRLLVVEWLNNQSTFNTGGTADLTYQIRLSETTGVIQYVYGKATMSAAGAADTNSRDPHIGFSSGNTAGTVGSVTAAQSGAPAPTFNGASATPVANLYAAGVIPVLNSATDGSRRTFTFTPPTPNAPTNLTFTAVTPGSYTLNWTDSANETLYAVYRSTDGTNYTFQNTAAQNATSFNATGLTPNTNYFWQVYAVSEGALSSALSGSQATNAPGNITSTAVGGNWSATTTWIGGVVPTATDNVTIADAATVTIDTAANAFSLSVGTGLVAPTTLQYEATTARTLTVATNVTVASNGTFRSATTGTVTTHVLSLGGNLTNSGVLDFSTTATNVAGAGITFTGAANNTFGGAGATTDVRTITINKGTSNANILELNPTVFTVRGAATDATNGYLTLTNGTYKISGTFTLSSRTFTANYTVAATSGIWLNNPNYTVSGINGSPTNAGLLRLTQGTYNVGTASGNSIDGSAGAVFIIEGGTLNTTGRFSPQSAVSYTQTGGAVNVCTVGQTSNSFGCFELFSTSSSFTMSGGTINLVQASTAATTPIDFDVLSGTINYTGGTLNIGTAATATNFNFRINGNAPAIAINNTTNNKTATVRAQTVVFGDTTVSPGTTLNLNGFLFAHLGANLFNNGTILGNTAGSRLYFAGTNPQQYGGSGVAGTNALPLQSVDFDSAGVTIQAGTTNNLITNRIILFTGGVTNANKLTLGTGGATAGVVQIGNTTTPTGAGSFDAPPTFNLGTGGQTISYLRETNPRTTGNEINPTRVLSQLTVDNNVNGMTIAGGDLAVTGALALTNGTVTTGSNTLISTSSGTLTRTNGYVIGNLRQTFTANGSKNYAVGTTNGFSPVVANVTAGTGDLTVRATQGKLPAISGANALARYWTLTGAGLTADLQFFYLAGDVTGTESSYAIAKNSGGTLTFPGGSVNAATHIASIGGVSSFSDWTLAEPAAVQSGTIQFDSPTYSVNEGAGTVTLNVTRAGGADGNVGVSYTTVDGTATSGAGNDYTGQSGTLGWAAGDASNKTIIINILDDATFEGDQAFSVNVNTPTGGATLGSPSSATVTINDNETAAPNVVYVDDDFTGANGTDPDGAGPATSIGFDAFPTVQGGVTGVAAGGTVNVASGNYPEQVIIGKSLTLAGAGAATTTIATPAALAPGIGGNLVLVEVNGGAVVNASGIAVAGPRVFNGCSPQVFYGVFVSGAATLNLSNSTVRDIRLADPSLLGCQDGIAIRAGSQALAQTATLSLDTVSVTNYQKSAVIIDGTGTSGTITGSTLTGQGVPANLAANAIQIGRGASATVTGNTVGGNLCNNPVCGPDPFTQSFSTGVLIFSTTNAVSLSNNTFSNNDVGIYNNAANTTVSGNTFTANRYENLFLDEGNATVSDNNMSGASNVGVMAVSFVGNAGNSTGTLTRNNITGAGIGLQMLDDTSGTDAFTPQLTAHFNRIVSTTTAIDNPQSMTADFENNWWGCNAGPGNTGCGAVTGAGADFNPWFVLAASATPDSIVPGGTSTVAADMTHNSDGAVPATALPALPVSYSATNGTMSPTNATVTSGASSSTFTSTNSNPAVASVTVDNQIINVPITVNAPSFSVDDVTHNEGNGGTTAYLFTVTKTGATNLASSVQFATVDGTATTADSDYQANSGTLNFGAADTTMQFTVNVSGDTTIEPTEAFTVNLSNASGAGITDADGTGTITNDDNPPPSVVYVDDDWVGLTAGTDPDGAGPATSIGFDAFPTIQGGVNGVAPNGTVNVAAGTYDEDVNVNKTLSLLGAGAGATNVRGPIGGSATTVQIAASNVTVAGFTITRLGNNTTDWNNPGLNSAGFAIQGQAVTGALIRDNVITGNRTAIDINNSNGHTVRNNVIDFNRTGLLYRNQTDSQTVVENFITNNWTVGILFLDGSGGTNSPVQSAAHSTFSNNNISANWYGQIVDRQTGGSLPAPATTNYKNFIGNWYGTTSPVVTTANSAEPGYAAQIPVAYGGTATPPGGQPDIAGPASANFKYTPFLRSGTDTNIETTPGRGTNGFQGVPNTIVVSPANLNGWFFFDDNPGVGVGSGGFEEGPATPPLGAGSAFLQVDDTARHALGTFGYGGTRLDDLSQLQYGSYQNNSSNPAYAPSLQFDIDYDLTDTTNTFQGRLVFEPYQSGTVQQNVWQTWDALAGNWYGTRATVPVGNVNVSNPCQQATPCTRQQILALFPNAGIRNTSTSLLLFKAGGPWPPGFRGNVDAFKLGVVGARVTYDFEALPNISINDVTHAEGNSGTTAYTFTVTLSHPSDQIVTVDYQTADDTATAPSDYTAVTTTQLSFAAGETTKQFTVNVSGDTVFEPNEAFFVNLSNASANATILDGQGVGAITNDDAAPAISINDVTVAEPDAAGTSNATFTVSLSNASAAPVSVNYQTADGTANAPADYNAVASTTLTFNPGETSKPVTVTVNADGIAEGAETFTVNLSNPTGGASIADDTGTGTITDPTTAGQTIISEFRFRGATFNAGGGVDGSRDEYVELYNNTDEPITVGASDGSAGWTVATVAGDGTTVVSLATIPAGAVIPARGHYLVAYSDTPVNPATGGYSLGGYAAPDLLYLNAEAADNAGVALFRTATAANFTAANRLDAAGFNGLAGATADMFREGAGLVSPGANDGEYAFVRKLTTGLPQDTGDNAADFTFVSTDGGLYGGVQSILGAPAPENSGNPVQRNGVIKASLIEPTAASTAPPNRVRSGQVQAGAPNAFGTLSIQRRFKNTTAFAVTRLRFRIVDITTLNSPVGGSPQADLRVLSSTGVVTNSQGTEVVTVTGLTLETPPAQANGGGLNSTLTVALPGGALAPGNTIDVQFLLGVQQQGGFRFLVNVEALPGLPGSSSPSVDQSNMKNRSTKTTVTPKAR